MNRLAAANAIGANAAWRRPVFWRFEAELHRPRFPLPSVCTPTLTRPRGCNAMAPRFTTRATDP